MLVNWQPMSPRYEPPASRTDRLIQFEAIRPLGHLGMWDRLSTKASVVRSYSYYLHRAVLSPDCEKGAAGCRLRVTLVVDWLPFSRLTLPAIPPLLSRMRLAPWLL